MTIADLDRTRSASQRATIESLRERMRGMEAPAVEAPGRPAPAPLSRVLPSLRVGAVHSVESRSLALLCLASAMPEGAWGAVVGVPDLGIEAAADAGVAVDRLVLVPNPGGAWGSAVAGLAEVMPVVLAAAPPGIAPGEAARLEARLRNADTCLIVLGAWPSPATRIRMVAADWQGTADGDGRIQQALLEVEVSAGAAPRLARVQVGRRRW